MLLTLLTTLLAGVSAFGTMGCRDHDDIFNEYLSGAMQMAVASGDMDADHAAMMEGIGCSALEMSGGCKDESQPWAAALCARTCGFDSHDCAVIMSGEYAEEIFGSFGGCAGAGAPLRVPRPSAAAPFLHCPLIRHNPPPCPGPRACPP